MTISVHNQAQLDTVLAALAPDLYPAKAEAPKAPKPSAETAATPPTVEAAPTPAADAQETKAEPSAPPVPAVETITYDQVRASILEVSKVKGRDTALKLLGQFGAAKGPDLQKTPDKFVAFVAAANVLLAKPVLQ